MRIEKKDVEYTEMTEAELKFNEQEVNKMRGRKMVGTISIRNHHSLHESSWIYRLAIDPN